MTTPCESLKYVTAWLSVVAAAVTAASCSAHDRTRDASYMGLGPLPTVTAAPASVPCTAHSAVHTLSLRSPDNRALQLAYVSGCGWRLLADTTRGARAFANVAAAPAGNSVALMSEPMTVFIDGPTGYTFAWSRDEGWKFIGHLVDETR
jgi:hypothetical protein